MVTRLYLPSSGAPPVSPAWDGAWDVTTNADRIRAVANLASGTPMSSKSTTETSAGAVNVLSRQYVAGPLAAGEISGTVKGRIRVQEANADADYRAQIVIRVVSEDGATVRGTLRAADAEALSSEFSTSLANRAFPLAALEPQALTPVTAQAGDWLVIEIGYRSHNEHTTSRNGTFRYGDVATSDCAENETATSDYNPWIEFSADIPFIEVQVRQVVGEVAHTFTGPKIEVRQVLAEVAHLYRGTGPEVRVRQVLAEVAWTPVTGDLYAVGNDLGEYEGEERGVPLSSDRSAWDDVDYPTRHARGMAAGDTHHREVTLGEESDPILTLDGQELTLGDVATQAELDAHTDAETGAHPASAISYDNGASGLTADDVQDAIDEIAGDMAGLPGADGDEKVKVSANDTTAGYLAVKLVEGDNVTLTETNDGGNETLVLAAVRPVNPMTAAGDIIYGGADGVETRLPIGDPGEVLRVNSGGTAPEWGTAPTITWAATTTTAGVTKTGNTGGTYRRFTQKFYVPFPLKITTLHIDLPGAGTYRVTLDTHAVNVDHATAYPWKVIAEEVEITPEEAEITFGANKEILPDGGPFVLMQGTYFLAVEKTGEEMAGHWDYHATRKVQGFGEPNPVPYIWAPVATELWGADADNWWMDDKGYHEDVSGGLCLPMRITAYKGTWVL